MCSNSLIQFELVCRICEFHRAAAGLHGRDARGRGHPLSGMHSHVIYVCVHAALLAVRVAPVVPLQQLLHTWLKFLASWIERQENMTLISVSAVCFVASLPDSQDFAAVHEV